MGMGPPWSLLVQAGACVWLGGGLQVSAEGLQRQVSLRARRSRYSSTPTSAPYGSVTVVAPAATTAWATQLVAPNGAVISVFTSPVSRAATSILGTTARRSNMATVKYDQPVERHHHQHQ